MTKRALTMQSLVRNPNAIPEGTGRRASHARSPSLRQTQGGRHEKAPCSSPARPRCWRAHRELRRGKHRHLPNFPAGADAVRGHCNSGRPIYRYRLASRDARTARPARRVGRPCVGPRRDRIRWHHGRRVVPGDVRRGHHVRRLLVVALLRHLPRRHSPAHQVPLHGRRHGKGRHRGGATSTASSRPMPATR